jgi:HEAT repeat protein
LTHPIRERLRSPDAAVRREACRAAAADPAGALLAEALVEALGDGDPSVVREAAEGLVALARTSPGIPALLRRVLREGPGAGRVFAALALARLSAPSLELLPGLVEGLAGSDGRVRWAAARVIVEMGRLHGELLAVLLGLVRNGEPASVRRMATFCLRQLAPDRPEAARVLLEATRDPAPEVRRAAFTALAGLLAPPREVAEVLLGALDDRDGAVRSLAALALAELRADAGADTLARALPRLRALRDAGGGQEVRRAARIALERLEGGVR